MGIRSWHIAGFAALIGCQQVESSGLTGNKKQDRAEPASADAAIPFEIRLPLSFSAAIYGDEYEVKVVGASTADASYDPSMLIGTPATVIWEGLVEREPDDMLRITLGAKPGGEITVTLDAEKLEGCGTLSRSWAGAFDERGLFLVSSENSSTDPACKESDQITIELTVPRHTFSASDEVFVSILTPDRGDGRQILEETVPAYLEKDKTYKFNIPQGDSKEKLELVMRGKGAALCTRQAKKLFQPEKPGALALKIEPHDIEEICEYVTDNPEMQLLIDLPDDILPARVKVRKHLRGFFNWASDGDRAEDDAPLSWSAEFTEEDRGPDGYFAIDMGKPYRGYWYDLTVTATRPHPGDEDCGDVFVARKLIDLPDAARQFLARGLIFIKIGAVCGGAPAAGG